MGEDLKTIMQLVREVGLPGLLVVYFAWKVLPRIAAAVERYIDTQRQATTDNATGIREIKEELPAVCKYPGTPPQCGWQAAQDKERARALDQERND